MDLSDRDSDSNGFGFGIMESAAKIIQRHQQPLSVIMERSTEDASNSRPSSSTSIRSNARPLSTDQTRREPAGITSVSGSTFSKKPGAGAGDSFVSLSESQARDMFDNDAKDRIEFLANQLGDQSDLDAQVLQEVPGMVDESLGAYFMRRSSHPVKGISEESAIFNSNLMDGTLPADFDNTRSLSASTPIPSRSMTQESIRRQPFVLDDDESVMEDQKNFEANESIAALYDYFKGPQSDGKRKDSMIDYVLDYCNKRKPESQTHIQPQQQQPPNPNPPASKPKQPRSPVKLNIPIPSTQNQRTWLNQSTTSSVTSFAKPAEHKLNGNGTRLVRHVTESKTQLNLSIHEKSVVTHKRANQSARRHERPSQLSLQTNVQPMQVSQPQSQQLAIGAPNLYSQSQLQFPQSNAIPPSMNAAYPAPQQYPPAPSPYGLPLVIQVYYPYPGNPGGYPPAHGAPPGTSIYVPPPPVPQQSYSMNTPAPPPQYLHAPAQFQQQTPMNSHALDCEPRSEPPVTRIAEKKGEREDGLSEYKENVPENIEKPNITIDKLAVVWEGCNAGGHTVEKLVLFNQGGTDLIAKCSFTDSEPGIFMMNVKSQIQSGGLVAVAKTLIKSGEDRTLRVAFRPKAAGRTVGKLRLEFTSSEREKDKSRRLSFVSYIPLVGFGYGQNETSLV